MISILLILLGICLMSVGMFFLILYLNLFTLGYSFLDFVKFIIIRFESLCFFIGLGLIIIVLWRENIRELLLRHFNKHKRR